MLQLCLTLIDDIDDKDLFENLFFSYRKQMVYLALTYVHNNEDAEDIVHDVFLNIAQRYMPVIKGIDNETDLRNYLLKATKNAALNKIRKDKKGRECISFVTDDIADDDFTERICRKSEYSQIIEAIKSLDEIYRDSLYCHFVLEIPVKQVAKMLNQSVSATKKQLVRGKKALISLLEE